MPRVDVVASCPVYDSFRVQQVAGMFDVPLADRASERFAVELPDETDAWQIGLIVGPSGSGKSTVLRRAYGGPRDELPPWPRNRAVVDGFGELPMRQIIELLTAVGFSSPPAWIKPYSALSTGERFRADLARALAAGAPAGQARSAEGDRPGAGPLRWSPSTSLRASSIAALPRPARPRSPARSAAAA